MPRPSASLRRSPRPAPRHHQRRLASPASRPGRGGGHDGPGLPASSPAGRGLRAVELALTPDQIGRIDRAGAPELGEPHVHNLDSDPLQEGGPFYRPAVPIA